MHQPAFMSTANGTKNGAGDGAGHLMSCAKNTIIFHQGDTARHWYEVLSGSVRTSRLRPDGHRQLIGFHFAGDVCGVEAGAYQTTAETITEATLQRHDVLPQAARPAHLERALSSAQRHISLFGHRTAHERLAAFILLIARGAKLRGTIQLPMSRADIADHLGLTIHTVSRTISDLARRQIVAPEGRQHLRIIDYEKLAAMACETEIEGSSS